MKNWKRFVFIFVILFSLGAFESYAMPNVMSDSLAMEKCRISYVMKGTDGKKYNLYILGDNEQFYGSRSAWHKTDYDQVYSADGYWGYISAINDTEALLQSTNLFGKKSNAYLEYMNMTDPTYMGGVYLITGESDQPDVLVTAEQMTGGGFISYRCFVIQNGSLTPMRFMGDDKRTHLSVIGTHKKPYGVEDGTIAFPWRRQKGFNYNAGSFVSVYMPDFTNLILIHGYTYEE